MSTDIMERRATSRPVELRAAPEGAASPGVLVGYAIVFDSESRDLGGWVEEIDPGAFGEAVEGGQLDLSRHHRVICRSEHDSRFLLGTTDAGTLRLFVDDVGVRYEVELPDTTAGRDAAVLAGRGDYRFSSFAFYTLPGGYAWRENAQGILVRRVTAGVLVDVAPVADPAYWGSSTAVQRDLDLDAVRASLNPPAPEPSGRDLAATQRARAFTIKPGARRGRESR